MKDNVAVTLWTGSGTMFNAYGKRGRTLTLIEWELGDAWVRMPLHEVAKNPDIALIVAVRGSI